MNKRTIDADKLYDFLEDYAPPHDEEYPGDWRSRIDAAFPLASPPTHNLVPLPESEWPEAHRGWVEGCELFALGDHHVLLHGAVTGNWWVYPRHTTSLHLGDGPTPAAALEAAGLPVELLEGLKRKQPAHENPRVVAAAVEMVKEVEQHGEKRRKDREEWLAQFPEWVREWCEIRPGAIPVRFLHRMAICFVQSEDRRQWVLIHQSRSVLSRWHPSLMEASRDASAQLYADGNVPLWGDEVEYASEDDKDLVGGVVQSIASETINYANGGFDEIAGLVLLRRHPAIADLPGIRNDSSADRSDSNDSAGEVTGYPQVELREGQRVTCEARYPNSVGFLVDHDPGSGRLEDRNTVCFGGTTWDTFRDDELTPIPPPLIDNGDGTWTMEGYGMFFVQYDHDDRCYYWAVERPDGISEPFTSEGFATVEAAAEDLWRRMEGVG